MRASLLIVAGEAVGLAVALALPGPRLDAACIGFVAANWLKAAALLWLLATGAIVRAQQKLAGAAAAAPAE
ncbi:MAG: hypothetical protein E6J91_23275 [Deltaproteobacteria bacterium]|nr:MAG: hypothetical protein E6J91_23275 [Deltaproteobacteria bacterium]